MRSKTGPSKTGIKGSQMLLKPFQAPRWMSKLNDVPTKLIKLVQTQTEVHAWQIKNIPKGFQLHIKRDDQLGNILAGNKIRKLEFLFADAINKESSCVITCGGVQSNHCRITAAVAKQIGLDCHLLLRSHKQEGDSKLLAGNQLLNRLHGAQCYMVPYETLTGGLNARLIKLSQRLKTLGEKPYIIPLGGSNHIGTYGIMKLFQELIEQGLFTNFDDIVLATGSGGSIAGLAIANYLTGEKVRVHGVAVCDDANFFYDHVTEELRQFGLPDVDARKLCDVIEGYKGRGYAKSTTKELDMLVNICRETGVMLDYCYTLKAVHGMLREMTANPHRFKGNRVLFIHTGGTFSVFDGVIKDSSVLLQYPSLIWNDINDLPV